MDSKKEFDSSLKIIAKSSIIVFIGLFLAKIFSYLYRLIIARNYGPESYGLFSLGLVMVSWLGVFAILGLNDGLLRYFAMMRGKKSSDKNSYLFRKSFSLLLITGILSGVILFIFAPTIANNIFKEPDLELFLKIFSFGLPLSVIMVVFQSALRSYEEVKWHVFIFTILNNFLQVTIIFALVLFGVNKLAIPISYTAGVFIVFITALLITKKKIPEVFKKSKNQGNNLFHQLILYSWPLIFAEIIWKVFKWTDSFLIGYFQTATEVGFYNAAIPIAFLLTFSSDLIMQMFIPLINKEYSQKKMEVVKQLSQQVGKWLFFINLPILILLIMFPEWFLTLLFGQEYTVAARATQILSLGVIFLSFSGVSTRLIAMAGKSKKLLWNTLVVALINVALNIFLIPKYGINGAAISTTICFILTSVIVTIQAYKETGIIPIRRKNINLVFATVISLLILIPFKKYINSILSFILVCILFMALYFLIVLLCKGFDKNDTMIFKSFMKKLKGNS